jgi:hypothetical protein
MRNSVTGLDNCRCSTASARCTSTPANLDAGEPHLAKEQHEAALRLARELGVPLEEAFALDGLARCDLALGRPEQAAESQSAAQTIYERLGIAAPDGQNRHA